MLHAGDKIIGDYELAEDEPFAEGATSEVWRCVRPGHDQEFAAKVLRRPEDGGPSLEQVREELSALTLLDHDDRSMLFVEPVKRGESKAFAGRYVLIYPLVVPMRDALLDHSLGMPEDGPEDDDTRALRRCVLWIAQMALAFDALHVCGRLHRDGHINNIFVHPESGRAMLGDLGLVGPPLDPVPEGRRRSYGAIGHPSSCAPSVIADGEFEREDDRYSLGHTAWTMLAGRSPLVIREDEPGRVPPPARAWVSPQVGDEEQADEVRRVLVRACAQQREDRYPNCRAMARDIARALGLESLVETTLEQAESISTSILEFREATSGGNGPTLLSEAATAPGSDPLSSLIEDMEQRDRETRALNLRLVETLSKLEQTDNSAADNQLRREVQSLRAEIRQVLDAAAIATGEHGGAAHGGGGRETTGQTTLGPKAPRERRRGETPAQARAAELVAKVDAELDQHPTHGRGVPGGWRAMASAATLAVILVLGLVALGGDDEPRREAGTPTTETAEGDTDTTETTPTTETTTAETTPTRPVDAPRPALNGAEERLVLALRDEIGAQKGTSLGCRRGPDRRKGVVAHLRCAKVGGGPVTVTKFRTVAGTRTYVDRLADPDAERVPHYLGEITGCFDDGEAVTSYRGSFTATWHNEDSPSIDRGQLLLRRRGKRSPMLIWSIYDRRLVFMAVAEPTRDGEQRLCRQYRVTV